MANSRKKQALFIDTVGTVSVPAMKPLIVGIMITPNAADSRVVIKESVSGTTVIDVKIETVETRFISFESFGGLEVTSQFEVAELTYIDSVILYGFWATPVNRAKGVI